jgi:hypothetical protein
MPMTVTMAALPGGLTLNEDNGDVTGTPTMNQWLRSSEVIVTNSQGYSTAMLNWSIDTLPVAPQAPITKSKLFDLVKTFSDRFDSEVVSNLANLLLLAEGRLSRMLRVREMADKIYIPIMSGVEYYPLPNDFAGMRNIQIIQDNGSSVTPIFINPELGNRATTGCYYTIINNQLRLRPPVTGEGHIEITYFRRIPNLVKDDDTTWLLNLDPDIYVSSLMMEIELFAKNDERVQIWSEKLNSGFEEISQRDKVDRWSGHALTIGVS